MCTDDNAPIPSAGDETLTDFRSGGIEALDRVREGDALDFARGSVAVCVPVFGAHGLFVQCLSSLLRHTPEDVPLLVADDASVDPSTERFLEDLCASGVLRHRLLYLRQEHNVGFVRNVNAALQLLAPADVVVLNSDCIVGPEWLERLRAAATSDTTIATATALTNHGTILSVPERNDPRPSLPEHLDVDRTASRVASRSRQLRPRIPTAIGHCMYLRRHALELVGDFDTAFSPGYGEEVDFSQRCLANGLCHVAADDVFVYHAGAGSFDELSPLQEAHERVLLARHPFYHEAVRATTKRATGALPRAIASASTALRPLSVTIDARFLGGTITGTQLQALEFIHALWRTQRTDLRILVPDRLGDWTRRTMVEMDGIELLSSKDNANLPQTDIVHRPSQLFTWPELRLITEVGQRFVLTHLDLISYRNPTYHSSFTDWREYQRLTRLALSLADRVVTMSEHARDDLLSEQLAESDRTRVVRLGVDHQIPQQVEQRRPRAIPGKAADLFLLSIGTNFRHKNRLFSLRVLEAMQERHGWDGWLVFAGPHAHTGTSSGQEAEFLSTRPHVAARVADLRAVEEDEKLWLLRHSAGVIYPTTYEGFGLVPFEAAENETPCFFAWNTALRNVLPESSATIVQWSADETADQIVGALANTDRKNDLIAEVKAAATELTWNRAAESMLGVYDEALNAPNRDIAALADERVPTTLAKLTRVRSPEVLDVEPELYRALLALTTHPFVRRPFRRAVKVLYRVGYTIKHGHPPRPLSGER